MPSKAKIIVAGPCAAESREQVLRIAKELSEIGEPFVYRAGVWKPRTSPATFQGIGDIGLRWLQEVQELYEITCATEVATPEQVRKTLDAGIYQLWIGARTSANPIAVQAIAEALDPRVRTIYVKNPVNEDVALWLGNIERFEGALDKIGHGCPIIAVHRGCGHRPCWAMAYHLRQQRPDITLLLDPSHMSGDREKVASLMELGRRLEYDGFMVEVHDKPEEALSDGKQQIPPTQLAAILQGEQTDGDSELLWQRCQIDEIDDDIWSALAQRVEIVKKIGAIKQAQHLAPYQPQRYQELLQKRLQWAKENGLSAEAVQPIFDAIHDLALTLQS